MEGKVGEVARGGGCATTESPLAMRAPIGRAERANGGLRRWPRLAPPPLSGTPVVGYHPTVARASGGVVPPSGGLPT
jgi:hypothetical protein